MSEQQTIPSVEPKPADRPRNALTMAQAFKLGQWTADVDLSDYDSLQELADAAAAATGGTVTLANMRTVLNVTGRNTSFLTARERAARAQEKVERLNKAAPMLLELVKLAIKYGENGDNWMEDAERVVSEAEGE